MRFFPLEPLTALRVPLWKWQGKRKKSVWLCSRCGISISEYCRTLALGGRPKERYTEEERELFREIARLKGTLQRLNNYFGGRQYREVFEENQALINELKKILSR